MYQQIFSDLVDNVLSMLVISVTNNLFIRVMWKLIFNLYILIIYTYINVLSMLAISVTDNIHRKGI